LRSVAAIGLAVLLAAGCGGSGLSTAQRDGLQERLAQARKAAGAHDGAGVRTALARFRARVRAARDDGAVSKDDADRLIAQALAASHRASAEIRPEPTPEATPTPTPAATVAPAPKPPEPPGKAKKDKKDKPGKGHGRGHEGR
jgi:hypothetical protein